jgi:hypothetical protein
MKTKNYLTWAELLLLLVLGPLGFIGVQHLVGFISDRITIEIHVKK